MKCIAKKHVPRTLEPRGERPAPWYVGRSLAGLILILLAAGTAEAQTPVYTVTKPDAVTGDNPPQNFTVPGVTCTNCRLPDPNGSVDQYSTDAWERPTQSGSSAHVYFPALDIRNGLVGFDATYLYYRIELFGVDPSTGGLPFFYGFEINFDADARGDMYIRVEDPRSKVGTTFGTSGVIAFQDANNNIGGANPTAPDGPGGTVDGYEFKAFDQGTNNSPGGAGGPTAVVARIVPGSPFMVEIAVRRVFLNALNGGSQVQQAAFRPYASKGGATNTESNFLLHDKFSRLESGSPYPWLQQLGAPGLCPNTALAETLLTLVQRDALDSGTNANTGIFNPCYPSGGNLVEFDNGGTLSDLAAGVDLLFFANVSGTVFEDVNYGGAAGRSLSASAGVVRANARVELYNSTGGFIATTTTNASGVYTFTSQPAQANYTVRVVNSTVTSSRPGSVAGLLPVQTFRTSGLTVNVGTPDADRVGGETPSLVDAGNGSNGAPANDLAALTTGSATAQSISAFTLGNSNVTGIDFGFNFSTIVNKNNAGQGSLRQFLTNSNTLSNGSLNQAGLTAGVETSIFMLSDGAAHPGLRAGLTNLFASGAATITLTSALPNITDANTALDGTRQTAITGDTNAAVNETTTGPEIILDVATGPGLQTTAANTLFDGLGITGSNGAGTTGSGLYFNGAGVTGSILRNSTLWRNDTSGITLGNSATNLQILNGIIRNNGVTDTGADGVELIGASVVTISGNQVLNNAGYGVDLHTTTNDNNTVTNNLVKNNGFSAADQDAGIGIRLGSSNTVSLNTITANQGDGVMVVAGAANQITQNTIHANGDLGIDLGGGNSGDGVTTNDPADADTGANDLLNFPVLTEANLSGGNLTLKGYARPGAAIEFFIAAADPTGFGEGQTYLVTLTEGSAADTDAGTGTYTSPVNGLNLGTDTTSSFTFVIAAPAGVAISTVLTATGTVSASTSEFSNSVIVQLTSGLVITPDAGTRPSVVAGQATPLFNFTVTNTGNASDQVRFLANGASARVTGPAVITDFVIDTDGSQTISAPDTDIKNNAADVLSASIAPNAFINVIVRVLVDTTAAQGEEIIVTLGDAATGSPGFDDQPADSSANEVRTVSTSSTNGLREARGDRTALVDNDAQIFLEMTAPSGPVPLGSDITYALHISNPGSVVLTGQTLTNAPAGSDFGVFIIAPIPVDTVLKSGQVFPAGTLYTTSPLSIDPLTAVWTTTPPADLTTLKRVAFNTGPALVVGTSSAVINLIVTVTTNDATNPIQQIADAFGRNSVSAGLTDQSGDISRTAGDGNANFDEGPLRGTIDGDGIIQLTTLQLVGGVLLGPLGQPGAAGPTDDNDDYTNRSVTAGIAGVAPGGSTTAGSTITFTNTLQNTGNADDTFTLTAPTVPAGFTVEISTDGGANYTIVSGGGSVTLAVNFGSQSNILVQITAPSAQTVLTGYATAIRATSGNNNTVFNETIDRLYTGYLHLNKSQVVTNGTGVGGATDAVPGADAQYTISYTNISSSGGTDNSALIATTFVTTDSIPANTDFKVGSVTSNPGTTGLTVIVTYSDDGGSTWTYTPVSGAGGAPAGYDRTVTDLRWSFTGNLGQTAPDNTGDIGFTVRIR